MNNFVCKFKKILLLLILLVSPIVIINLVKTVSTPYYISKKMSFETSSTYNILDYGAKSNHPNFDNAEVINEIIKNIDEKGGNIHVPVGNFYVNSPIIIDRSYISIIGNNSGLRSGVDNANIKTQAGGGGSRIIARPGVNAIEINDDKHPERISGITFRSFQIRGQANNGIGINGVQDTDRVLVDDLVINNIGIGIQLNGADAPTISNSWIAETNTSIRLTGASQQANIIGNSLGAQPRGVTIELENAQWFNITGNNIYPDGSTNIRLFNPTQGNISSNNISSRYNAAIELLPNKEGVYGKGNLINSNVISLTGSLPNPDKKNEEYGIVHLESDDTIVNGNVLNFKGLDSDYVGINIDKGKNNRISNNLINFESPFQSKVMVGEKALETTVINSSKNEEFTNKGGKSNINRFTE